MRNLGEMLIAIFVFLLTMALIVSLVIALWTVLWPLFVGTLALWTIYIVLLSILSLFKRKPRNEN